MLVTAKDSDNLYYPCFGEKSLKEIALALARERIEWNHLPLKQLGTGVWMEQKAKQGREERVLDWTMLKQGENEKKISLQFIPIQLFLLAAQI